MAEYLVIDIGTSSLKAALINEKADLLAQEKVHLLTLPGADLAAWDPSLWDLALKRAVSLLAPERTLRGIAVSGNGPTMVPMRVSGEAAGRAILWLGRDQAVTAPAGSNSYFLPQAAWLRERKPQIFEDTSFFLTCPGYLSYRLCGNPCGITPNDTFAPYLWDDEQILAWGFPTELFPPLIRSGERIGYTAEAATDRYGLEARIPVYAGGPDYMMAVIGAGAVRPGLACDRAGTSEGINFCADRAVDSARLRTLPHAVEGLYTVAGILASTGRVFEWFRRITNQTERDYGTIIDEIRKLDPESYSPRFFPSRHRGPVWDFNDGIFAGLQPEHTHVELGKGVVEAIAFGILDVVETLADEGCPVTSLRGTGGQYRNRQWNQMKADILGVPLEVPQIIDGELTGNLCAALVGEGQYASLAEAAGELVRIGERIEPDRELHGRYRELADGYRRACSSFTT